MVRSKLRNKYLEYKFEIGKQRYNKQRSYCFRLLRLKKQKYYESLDINKTNGKKNLSEDIKLFIFKQK